MSGGGEGASRNAAVALHAGFFLTGIFTVLLGPAIPELEARWGVSHSEAAWLFIAQFATSSLGSVVSSFRLRWSLLGGYGSVGLGLLILAVSGWPLALGGMALVGFGLGLVIPATNLAVALANPERRGASLATLNLVWGLGATLCPLIFAALRGRVSVPYVLMVLAVLAVFVVLALAPRLEPSASEGEETSPTEGPDRGVLATLLLIAAMLFLYIGSETALGGWVVAFTDQLSGEKGAASMVIGSCFWGALLAGRGAAALVLRRLSERFLFTASLFLGGVGTSVVFLADSRITLGLGAALAGFGLGPIFPLTVSMLAAATAATRSRGTGWVFAFGGLGGAILPWLAGQVAGSESLRLGFLVPLAGIVLLGLTFWGVASRETLKGS